MERLGPGASRRYGFLAVGGTCRSQAVLSCAAMKILLNGETVDAREAKTIADLVDRYQLPPRSIVVEHNGLAVHRHEGAERPLAEGDRVEFIHVVAGG